MPSHFDRERTKVDRRFNGLQPKVALEATTDQLRERCAVVSDGDHFRDCEKVCDGDGNVALEFLLPQRLEYARANATGW
jgi:hypothetical protein